MTVTEERRRELAAPPVSGRGPRSWLYALTTTNPPPAAGDDIDGMTRWIVVTRAAVLPMTLFAGLVGGLATRTAGLVVVGDTRSGGSGSLAGLRAEPGSDAYVSVDGAETALGRVTSVLGLLRALAGDAGSFGASGADGAVPVG